MKKYVCPLPYTGLLYFIEIGVGVHEPEDMNEK